VPLEVQEQAGRRDALTAAIGEASLWVALVTTIYAGSVAIFGAALRRRDLVASARRAFYCVAGLVVLAVVLLQAAYVRTDLSFDLVARNSSDDTPLFYKLTAMWSSQEGSLLLWALLLSVYTSIVLLVTRRRMRDIVPWATAVLAVVTAFFISLMVFGENPFATTTPAPQQGAGLEPLLRHPAMAIHPPMLYSGYVGFAIPFAFAIGALITRRTDADWIRATRRFALIAWTLLTCGILLGALWSFSELGWGGYWAWDPVENASLMPWLLGTAFLHSVMVQEKRGMLKVWNVTLIVGAFVMALLGTFLVRSGILDSIHAFGASTLGTKFLVFIGVVLLGSAGLIFFRRNELRSEAKLDSFVSREAFFLLNNLVLVVMCLVVFWGTFFPIITDALPGVDRQSLGPSWFNRVSVPLALVLVLLSGIGPMLTWRRASRGSLRRAFQWPLAACVVALVGMLVLTPAEESVTSLIMFTLCAFVLAVVIQEVARGTSARRTMTGEGPVGAFGALMTRNRRRYGGFLVHAGVAIAFLGVAASSAFVNQRDVRMVAGQTTKVGDYEITYERPTGKILDDASGTNAPITFGAVLKVRRGGESWTMEPQRNYYTAGDDRGGAFGRFFMGESTSEVDLRWGVTRDLWTAVQPDLSVLMDPIRRANRQFADTNGETQALIVAALAERYRRHAPPATFRFIDSPMVAWIWIGGGLGLIGSIWALWPAAEVRRRRESSLAAARLGRELARPL
jgi:cytochrome c-type biogenesis protein CcmF